MYMIFFDNVVYNILNLNIDLINNLMYVDMINYEIMELLVVIILYIY